MPGRDPERVLIVEDDADIREAIAEVVESEGHEAIQKPDGRTALDWLRSTGRRPCLVLLDLMMPVLDGYGFLAERRSDPRLAEIPVVVISAVRDTARTRSEQPAALLAKPIDLDRLVGVLREFCS